MAYAPICNGTHIYKTYGSPYFQITGIEFYQHNNQLDICMGTRTLPELPVHCNKYTFKNCTLHPIQSI